MRRVRDVKIESDFGHDQRYIHFLRAHAAVDANLRVAWLTRQPVLDHRIVFHDQRVIADTLLQPCVRRTQAKVPRLDQALAVFQVRVLLKMCRDVFDKPLALTGVHVAVRRAPFAAKRQ